MSSEPAPAAPPSHDQPLEVVVISHSQLFYWWPVWAFGFLMAIISWGWGEQVAFVPSGTVAKHGATIEGVDGPRDVLVAPAGASLPTASDGSEPPRMRVTVSNSLGVIWATVLCFVILVTNVPLRGLWSILILTIVVFATILIALVGLWDPILRAVSGIDIHISAFGYFAISLILFVLWLLVLLLYDRQIYLVFSRGQMRVRMAIGAGESVFDTRGIVVEKHRDDVFRHWLLGFGAGDLTVKTSGTNPRYFEVPNVFRVAKKLAIISKTVKELQVVQIGV
jgi:hypothetical protein